MSRVCCKLAAPCPVIVAKMFSSTYQLQVLSRTNVRCARKRSRNMPPFTTFTTLGLAGWQVVEVPRSTSLASVVYVQWREPQVILFYISSPFLPSLGGRLPSRSTNRQAIGHVDSLQPGSKLVALASFPSNRSFLLAFHAFAFVTHYTFRWIIVAFPLSKTFFCARWSLRECWNLSRVHFSHSLYHRCT